MARIGARDLGRITRFVAMSGSSGGAGLVSRRILLALRDLVGADDAEYFELSRPDRAVIAHVQVRDVAPDAEGDDALRRYGHENPLNWRRWRPADGAMRLSSRIDRRALRRLEFYHAYLRPRGLTDNLKVWLHAGRSSAACVQLWRIGGTFTQRDEDVLGVLQHHLMSLRAGAAGLPDMAGRREPMVTRREAEVLTWAVRGDSDAAIAERLGISPGTVGKHLENAFAALRVRSRTEALWQLTAARETAAETDRPDVPRGVEGR